MNQKDKTSQQILELSDSSASEKQDEGLSFVLKIYDGHLSEIKASAIINMLSALNRIVGIDEAGVKTVKEGSITIALSVPSTKINRALLNVKKTSVSNNHQIARIQKELTKYGLNCADISYGVFNHNGIYEPKEVLLEVPQSNREDNFTQEETLDGCVTRLQKGKDESDHITIILNNGVEVPAECSHAMLQMLHKYFNTATSLRFKGIATYLSKENSYELKLKKFIINSFTEIENINIDDWIDNFRSKGASGWSKFDDPIAEWIKERQD